MSRGETEFFDVASTDIIEKMCEEFADAGDYLTLAHMLRVNKTINKICQKSLDNMVVNIIIQYRFGYGDDEYVIFPFRIYGREYRQLETELNKYNEWIKRHKWDKEGFGFTLTIADEDIHYQDEEHFSQDAKQLYEIIEERSNIDQLITGEEDYKGGAISIGFGTPLPLTISLIKRGTIHLVFDEKLKKFVAK